MKDESSGVYLALALVVLGFILLGLAYARATPAWQAPDEPAHFNYVTYLAGTGQLPILEPGDYPAGLPLPPTARLTDISVFRYESHQPPLFYALAAIAYELHPSLSSVRALSVLFGAALLPVVFWCGRFVLPGEPWLWLGAAGFVAFIPMHLFVAGSANNDTLADLVLSLLLLAYLALVAGWKSRWRWPVLGLLLGLAMLSKLTIYPAAVLLTIAGVCVPSITKGRIELPPVFKAGAITLLVAAAVSGWWFIRNGLIYGWDDMLAQSRQAQVAGSQTRTGAFGLPQFGNWVAGSFHSFWGQFGWMSLPLPQWQYLLLLALTAVVLVGWLMRMQNAKFKIQSDPTTRPRDSSFGAQDDKWASAAPWLGLAIVWFGTTGSYLYYNITFLQTQGRYVFPALAPIGIVCAAGTAAWFPRRTQPAAMVALSLAMLAFAVYTLQRELVPAFR